MWFRTHHDDDGALVFPDYPPKVGNGVLQRALGADVAAPFRLHIVGVDIAVRPDVDVPVRRLLKELGLVAAGEDGENEAGVSIISSLCAGRSFKWE